MRYRVGIAQINPDLGDVDGNLQECLKIIDQAKRLGIELLVFPELSLTGYSLQDAVPEVAITLDSEPIHTLCDHSEDLDLVIGFVEEGPGYQFYSSAAYLSGQALVHVHRKVYLPTYGAADEQRFYASGTTIRAFDTKFGRTAMLISADALHPSAAYIAAQQGAEKLIILAANAEAGISTEGSSFSVDGWQIINRFYAKVFGQHVIYANRVGCEDGLTFQGRSEILGPGGEMISQAKPLDADLLTAVIDTADVRRARIAAPLLREENLDLTLRELKRIMLHRQEKMW